MRLARKLKLGLCATGIAGITSAIMLVSTGSVASASYTGCSAGGDPSTGVLVVTCTLPHVLPLP